MLKSGYSTIRATDYDYHATTQLQGRPKNETRHTMQKDLQEMLRQLQFSPIDKVREHLDQAHHKLEADQLAQLQQAFIRLPYSIDPSALMLFDEISISLQTFTRKLLQHYIFESEILKREPQQSLAPTIDRTISDRLRFDHQSLQESLSDLQSLTYTFSEVARSTSVLRFHCLLNELAENLQEQILTEDTVLLPRCCRN